MVLFTMNSFVGTGAAQKESIMAKRGEDCLDSICSPSGVGCIRELSQILCHKRKGGGGISKESLLRMDEAHSVFRSSCVDRPGSCTHYARSARQMQPSRKI